MDAGQDDLFCGVGIGGTLIDYRAYISQDVSRKAATAMTTRDCSYAEGTAVITPILGFDESARAQARSGDRLTFYWFQIKLIAGNLQQAGYQIVLFVIGENPSYPGN